MSRARGRSIWPAEDTQAPEKHCVVVRAASASVKRRGHLSRSPILASALELVDLDGLEALSMRRLAEALNVDPMSLYDHVDGKESLLDGLAEVLWNEVQLPAAEVGGSALRALAISLRDLAHRHPYAYRLLFGRGLLPQSSLSAMDRALTALQRAGLDRNRAAEMLRTLVAYAAGCGMLELSARAPTGNQVEQIVRSPAPCGQTRLFAWWRSPACWRTATWITSSIWDST